MSIQEIYHSTWLGLARLKPVIWMSRRLGTLSSRYFSSWVRERNPSNTAQTQTAITKATKCWGKMAVYLWARKPRYSLGEAADARLRKMDFAIRKPESTKKNSTPMEP